jgi:hypothetical protein
VHFRPGGLATTPTTRALNFVETAEWTVVEPGHALLTIILIKQVDSTRFASHE